VEDLKTTGRTHNRILATGSFRRMAGHTLSAAGSRRMPMPLSFLKSPTISMVLYAHMKRAIFSTQIMNSGLRAGSYMIVVAEGIKIHRRGYRG